MDVSKIKNELLKQKKSKFKGNIYHFSQVNFAYNSNKIEGSKLTDTCKHAQDIYENICNELLDFEINDK